MPPQAADQLVGSAAVGQRMPALGAVLAGPRGTIWLLDAARTAEELVDLELPGGRTWRVYARDGRLIGTASTPVGFRAARFVGALLSGIVFDELGATSALVLRVQLYGRWRDADAIQPESTRCCRIAPAAVAVNRARR